jgi:hypothetical protein
MEDFFWKSCHGNNYLHDVHAVEAPPPETQPNRLSRGVNAEHLKGLSVWWNDPSWLSHYLRHYPRQRTQSHHPLPDEKTVLYCWIHPKRRSPYRARQVRFLLETAPRYGLRSFVQNTRYKRKPPGELDASELADVCTYWIK